MKSEIQKTDYKGDFTFGIVLTGGGAKLNNVDDLAQEIFQKPIKIGQPHLIGGVSENVNNPKYSTCVGLIQYGTENWLEIEYDNSVNINSVLKKSFSKMSKLFSNWY